MEYILWNVDKILILSLAIISIGIILVGYLGLRALIRKSIMTLEQLVYFKRIITIIIASIWIFNVLYVHIALFCYAIFCILMAVLKKEDRIIRYYYLFPSRKYNSVRFEKALIELKSIKAINNFKKEICLNTSIKAISKNNWSKTKLPWRFNLIGFIVCFISILIRGDYTTDSSPLILLIINNFMGITGVLSIAYLLLYYIGPNHGPYRWEGISKFFHISFAIISIICYCIVLAISLGVE